MRYDYTMVAIHEAGHAVIAHHYGWAIASVVVYKNAQVDGTRGEMVLDGASSNKSWKKRLDVNAAGMIAEGKKLSAWYDSMEMEPPCYQNGRYWEPGAIIEQARVIGSKSFVMDPQAVPRLEVRHQLVLCERRVLKILSRKRPALVNLGLHLQINVGEPITGSEVDSIIQAALA
jgi:hypothetical protein